MQYKEPSHLPIRHDRVQPPGPGDYDVAGTSSIGKKVRKNRTNIMISTAPRTGVLDGAKRDAPGPGTSPQSLVGTRLIRSLFAWGITGAYTNSIIDSSWTKPSHNILIAEQSSAVHR